MDGASRRICHSLQPYFGFRSYAILQFWDKGETSMATKNYAGAERLYRRALRLDSAVAKSHLLLAGALVQQRKLEQAIPELRLAVRDDRTDAAAYMTLGECLQSADKPDQAEPVYAQAIA